MNEVENCQTVQSEVEKEKSNRERKPKNNKPTQTAEPKPAIFPAKEFVNQWGFIHLSREALEAFGVNRTNDNKKPYEKTNITIDLQQGALIIKKV
jgi:hypothetical protein